MNALSFRVLRRLADGDFHSGAALADALDISRGSVWNAVRAIEAAGLDIYKVRGRGYRLARAISLLERDAVRKRIGPRAEDLELEIIERTPSTNTLLAARAAAGARNGTTIVAESQTHGRGRFGRAWLAGLGGGITFSLLWRFPQGASALAGLSLAAGVALMRALRRLGVEDARLKWPNDVTWRGGKLAGILIEMQGDALGPSCAAIGIGINVRMSQRLQDAIDQPAVDLESACGRAMDRNEVLGVVLDELAQALAAFSVGGFAPLRGEWEQYHAHQNQMIDVTLPDGRVERGIARGVGEDGTLVVETEHGARRLHTGEVTVRPARAGTGRAATATEAQRPV